MLWHEFGGGQHRYALLVCGIIVYVNAGQPLSTIVWGTS